LEDLVDSISGGRIGRHRLLGGNPKNSRIAWRFAGLVEQS
jgi:hypothetical protein